MLDERRKLLTRLYLEDDASLQHHFLTVSDVTADFIAWNSAQAEWRAFELASVLHNYMT